MDNDFLKNLDTSQVREIVDSMYPQEFPAGSWVIREGDVGEYIVMSFPDLSFVCSLAKESDR